MAPPYTKCTKRPASTHSSAKELQAQPRDYRPQGGQLPIISPELTSELLHCLSTLPDPWPLAKITIDMEKPSQWVSKLCRLYFADEYARRTTGVPSTKQVPDIETPLKAVQKILPQLEARMIEFFGRMASYLSDTSYTRIGSEGTSSFLYVPQRILVS